MNIKKRIIPAGRRNRPMTNPASSLFNRKMVPRFITIHNTGNRNPGAGAANHASYIVGDHAASRPASWHFSVDDTEIWQHLPLDESGWHAGDNLGPGNTTTIGIEICENHLPGNMTGYLWAEELAAKLCAHLIATVPTLAPFPDCLRQHWHWSGKNCPSVIRGRSGGWEQFVSKVQKFIARPERRTWHRVVAGSYLDRDNAEMVRRDLMARGVGAWIYTFTE